MKTCDVCDGDLIDPGNRYDYWQLRLNQGHHRSSRLGELVVPDDVADVFLCPRCHEMLTATWPAPAALTDWIARAVLDLRVRTDGPLDPVVAYERRTQRPIRQSELPYGGPT